MTGEELNPVPVGDADMETHRLAALPRDFG